MKIPRLASLAAALALGALGPACGGPPLFAVHACGQPSRSVQMPLSCLSPADVLAGQPDHAALISRTLADLVARSTGRPAETMSSLSLSYQRLDRALRSEYAAACKAWSTACDHAQEVVYLDTAARVRARSERLLGLQTRLEDLARSGRSIELSDDGTKSLLTELEAAVESATPTPAPPPAPPLAPDLR